MRSNAERIKQSRRQQQHASNTSATAYDGQLCKVLLKLVVACSSAEAGTSADAAATGAATGGCKAVEVTGTSDKKLSNVSGGLATSAAVAAPSSRCNSEFTFAGFRIFRAASCRKTSSNVFRNSPTVLCSIRDCNNVDFFQSNSSSQSS